MTETEDRLWLLSVSEVYGSSIASSDWAATYDAEGTQYQLYADQGVTMKDYGFCKKSGVGSSWWLRSPYASRSGNFRLILDDGDGYVGYAALAHGVSPGFCL